MKKIVPLFCLIFLAFLLPEMAHSASAPSAQSDEPVLAITPSAAPSSIRETAADKKKSRVERFVQKRLEKKLTNHVKSTTAMDRGLKSALIWGLGFIILASVASWLASAGLGIMGGLVGLVALVVLIVALLKFLAWLSTQ